MIVHYKKKKKSGFIAIKNRTQSVILVDGGARQQCQKSGRAEEVQVQGEGEGEVKIVARVLCVLDHGFTE